MVEEGMTLRVVELFSGIGAQRMALMQAGIPHEVVAICEINKHALASYQAIYGDCPNLGDITKVQALPPCDLVTYSFPCQDLSLAGKRKGMGKGTRSGLVWEVVRLLESAEHRPEWLLMENVPQVLTSPLWPDLLDRLTALGYRNKWVKLDSSRFGSAQKRVRAFMVSRLDAEPPDLPQSTDAPARCIRDIMEPQVGERYVRRIPLDRVKWREPLAGYRPPQSEGIEPSIRVVGDWDKGTMREANRRIYDMDGACPAIEAHIAKDGQGRIKILADWQRKGIEMANRLYDPDHASPAVVTHGGGDHHVKVADHIEPIGQEMDDIDPTELVPIMQEGEICPMLTPGRAKRQRGPRFRNPNEPAFTVNCQDRHGCAYPQGGDLVVRVLTPLECWRLMGFPDWAYDRASKVSSETQLYNQAGNSIVVQVLEAIFKAMQERPKGGQATLERWGA